VGYSVPRTVICPVAWEWLEEQHSTAVRFFSSLTFSRSLLVVALGWPVAVPAADSWPAFRGPNSAGVAAPSAKPPVQVSPTENVLWSVEVPWAPGSPCVWGDRVFLSAFQDGKLETRAYSTRDGKLLWNQSLSVPKLEEFHATEGSPAASTPVTDGQIVVNYFGSFGLIAYDAATGAERWRLPLPVADTMGNFGSGTSPMLVGDRIILNRDLAVGSHILAVDLKTGKKLWDTPRPDSITSYGSPILWEHDGQQEIVMAGSLAMKAYDVATGAERWVLRGLASYNCTTPVVGDGLLFYAGWSPGKADSPWPSWDSTAEKQDKNGDGKITVEEFEGGGPAWFRAQDVNRDGVLTREDWDAIGQSMKLGENALIAVKPGAKGVAGPEQVAWKFSKGLPYVPSPLYYQGRVYLIRDGGMMSSFDAKTGQPFYAQERIGVTGSYYASPVAADGRIYVTSLDGKFSVIKAGGDKPEVLHTADFGERISATPAVVGDRLYLRTKSKLYAFGPETAR
jgi:outer membrane protein assembly factor BamB